MVEFTCNQTHKKKILQKYLIITTLALLLLVNVVGAASLSYETWQGQGNYNGRLNTFQMNLKTTIPSNTFSGTLEETTLNGIVSVNGRIGELSSFNPSDQNWLNAVVKEYGISKGTFVIFTDPKSIQGNKIVLNCIYCAVVSDSSLKGIWFYPWSTPARRDGTFKLTCENNLKLSNNGLNFIKKWEKLRLKMYDKDGAGVTTIGYGHKIHDGKIDGRASEAPFKNGITPDKALSLLKSDVATAESSVNSKVKVPLNQYQFDALVSITFNSGPLGSPVLNDLNKGNYNAVSKDILTYRITSKGKKLEGLKNRRNDESPMFSTGKY